MNGISDKILVVYPRAQINWTRRVVLFLVLSMLMVNFFARRLVASIIGRIRSKQPLSSSSRQGRTHRYDSTIYAVDEHYRLSDLPPGNCWYQLAAAIPAGAAILDVGCSTGHLGRLLMAEKPLSIDGIEIDPKAAALARNGYNTVYIANLDNSCEVLRQLFIDIPDTKYDIMLFMDVLEHLVEPEGVLKALQTKLKCNGIAIISIPNIANWQVRFELLCGRFEYTDLGILDRTHVRFFTLSTMIKLLDNAGYTVQWVATTFPGWHELFTPLKHLPMGSQLRIALLIEFPELLSKQFLLQATPKTQLVS